MKTIRRFLLPVIVLAAAGCTTELGHRISNTPSGRSSTYVNPGTPDRIGGLGIDSQDVIGLADKMVRSMLAERRLAGGGRPRIIVDAAYFKNQSSSRIDKDMITDRLRSELMRAARGRMVFVSRHYADAVEKERGLKTRGALDGGSMRRTHRPMGADYRLGGRITELVKTAQNGRRSRYFSFVFEMVDLETSELAWSDNFQFEKEGQDDVVFN